jgi:hypothetical protein
MNSSSESLELALLKAAYRPYLMVSTTWTMYLEVLHLFRELQIPREQNISHSMVTASRINTCRWYVSLRGQKQS